MKTKISKTTRPTLWTQLSDADHEELLGRGPAHTRKFTAGAFAPYDGMEPIVCIGYTTDFKAEEEWGIGDLRKAITGPDERNFGMVQRAATKITQFQDLNAILISTEDVDPNPPQWGDDIGYRDDYAKHFNAVGIYGRYNAEELRVINDIRWGFWKVDQLKRAARKIQPKGKLPTRKADLQEFLVHKMLGPPTLDEWPGWFQDGRHLIMRADHSLEGQNLTARVLEKIIDAARDGYLGIGDGGGAFRSGLVFYDTRDETEELRVQRNMAFDWHDAAMADLEPVIAELKDRGFRWRTLDTPRVFDENVTMYWFNGDGLGTNETKRTLRGWYSLEELLAEKFVIDIEAEEV